MQALKISFTTPTATHGARVKVEAPQGTKKYGYDHALSNEGNAKAAAERYVKEMNWPGELTIGHLKDAVYVAVFIPDRFLKARDAVIAARVAIREGDMRSGNPHTKKWCQRITDLTDGVALRGEDGFSREYMEKSL